MRAAARMLRARVRVRANIARARAMFVPFRSPASSPPGRARRTELVREPSSARSVYARLLRAYPRTRSPSTQQHARVARVLAASSSLSPVPPAGGTSSKDETEHIGISRCTRDARAP